MSEGGTKAGSMVFEMDLDRTKLEKGLQDELSATKKTVDSMESAWRALGTKSDEYFASTRTKAIQGYEYIAKAGTASAEQIARAAYLGAAKIDAINQKQFGSYVNYYQGLIAQAEASNVARNNANAQYWMTKITQDKAMLNAEIAAYEENAMRKKVIQDKLNADNAQWWMQRITQAKVMGRLEVEAYEENALRKKAIQDKQNLENSDWWMNRINRNRAMLHTESEAWAENAARNKTIQNKAAQDALVPWQTLNIRSTAAIKNQMELTTAAATQLQAQHVKGSQDWLNIEKAKNDQLKHLNKEMVMDHDMSMAAMTRMLLRFYAAYYVVSTGIQYIGSILMSGIKSIDDMKISAVAVAAQITSMQGSTENISENYKTNLEYAKALVPVLMQIDALSLANLSEIQRMNMSMTNQGVILDINKQKQIEAFTALTNAVAIYTQGQDKEKQAAQEMRSLFSGQVRAGDMVAMQMDAMIKKQGEYKGGLKELVKEGKAHGDTLERMLPYLTGIVAASGDLQMTWSAVSSSMETAWVIIQRGLFKDIYKDLTKQGSDLAQYLKDNADDIVEQVQVIKDALKFATLAAIGFSVAMALIAAEAAFPAAMAAIGSAVHWLAIQLYDGTLMATIWGSTTSAAVNAVTFSFKNLFMVVSAGFAGYMIGGWLNQFETVRQFGVAMVYGLIDAWEALVYHLKVGWQVIKGIMPGTDGAAAKANIEALKKQYDEEKKVRDQYAQEQFNDVTDAAIKLAKEKKKIETPDPKNIQTNVLKDSVKDYQEALRSKMQADKAYYDEQIKTAEQSAKLAQRAGQDEFKTIKDLYNSKENALNDYMEIQYKNAEKQVQLEAQAAAISKDGIAKRFDYAKVLQAKYNEIYAKYNKEWAKNEGDRAIANEDAANKSIEVMANLYKTISGYSDEAISYQIKLLEKKYIQEGRFSQGSLALAIALKVEEDRLWQEQSNAYADFYSKIQGYEEEYRENKLDWIDREEERLAKFYDDDLAAAKWAADEKGKLEYELFKKKTDYVSQGFGDLSSAFSGISKLYATGSEDAKKWQAASDAMLIAQKAVAVVQAVGAIATQGLGDPYTAFVRVAAMAAAMGALLATIGETVGGSTSSASIQSYQFSDNVLGAEAGTGSESIQKSWELMQDTYDMEYHELRGIYDEMKDLNANITGLVTSLVRTGGVSYAAIATGDFKSSTAQFIEDKFDNLVGLITDPARAMGLGFLDPLGKWLSGVVGGWVSSAWNSIFGGDMTRNITGQGIQLSIPAVSAMLSGANVGASSYTSVYEHTDGGWFKSDSDSYYTVYGAVSEQVSNLFSLVFRDLSGALVELSEGLGQDVTAAMRYSFGQVTINLQGMSAEQINTTIQEYLSAVSDAAVSTLFGSIIAQYQELGEGLMETAVRLMVDKEIVLEVLAQTNQAYSGSTANAIALSEALIHLAGDLETLTDIASTYYDKFFTDAEKQADLYSNLSIAMADMNLALPDSREAYRAIVEGLDLTTLAGQSAYFSLMAMAEGADTYYTTLEDVAEDAANATADLVNELKSLSTTIAEWLASLGISNLNPVLSEQSYKNQYTSLLAAAKSPSAGTDAINDYLNYATTFLTYQKSFGTSGSYQAIYDAVVADVMAIQAINTAALASYASGTSYVPETGLYQLHQGEIVSRKSDSVSRLGQEIGKYIIESNGGSNGGDIHVSVQIDGKEIGNVVAKQTKTNSDLQKSIRSLN